MSALLNDPAWINTRSLPAVQSEIQKHRSIRNALEEVMRMSELAEREAILEQVCKEHAREMYELLITLTEETVEIDEWNAAHFEAERLLRAIAEEVS